MRGITAVTLVIAMLAAACGSDAAEPTTSAAGTTPATAPTTAASAPQTVASDDGMLVLDVPAGSPEVTVTAIEAEEAGVGEYDLILGAYDLGPGGSTFDTPVTAIFDTGLEPDLTSPVPLLAAALENEDGDLEILPSRIDTTGDTVVVTAEVDHFSLLVIVGSPDALILWPEDIIAPVGAVWWADWGIYDARALPLTNRPARIQHAVDEWSGESGLAPVRPLIKGISVDPDAWATGVVNTLVDDGYADTWLYLPEEGTRQDGGFSSFVEILWGDAKFGCEVEGSGTYGFAVSVILPPGSVAFATRRTDGRRAIVVPSRGATLEYSAGAPAICIDTRYGTMVSLLSRIMGIPAGVVEEMIEGIFEDGMHDGIWSISQVLPGIYVPHVDLWDSGLHRTRIDRFTLDSALSFSLLECGTTVALEDLDGAAVTTVCADDTLPITDEDMIVASGVFSGPIPIDGDGSEYVYSAVFESNGDPADDWEFQGDFDWDFFRDTDRWYQVFIHADGTAEMTVTDTTGPPLPSGARALIFEDTVLWFIPAGEFDGDTIRGRITGFVHDGTYDPASGMGDVTGADPTEALIEVIRLEG